MSEPPPPPANPPGADALGRAAVRGGATALVGQGARFGVTMLSTVILARLLGPEDYGLASMVLAITGLLSVFNDIGFSLATIQKQELSEAEHTAAFWLQLGLSAGVMCAAAAFAPLIGLYYHEPRATWIALATAPTFLLVGASAQHLALLRRDLRFQLVTGVEVAGSVVGLAAGVAVAAVGGGTWALVAQPVVQQLVQLPAFWVASGWRPGAPAFRAARGHFDFGKHFAVYKIVEYVTKSADRVILGRWFGTGEVGLYSRATSLLTVPFTQLSFPLSLILLPALSRAQADPPTWRALYRGGARVLGWLTLPLAVFLFVAAEDVVWLLLGPTWSRSVRIFQWASPGALAMPLSVLVNWIFLSLGRTDRMLRWGLASGAVTLLATVLGAPHGAEGVALARSLAAIFAFGAGLVYGVRGTPLSLRDVVTALAPPLVGAAAVGAAVWGTTAWAPDAPLVRLACASAAAAATVAAGLVVTGDYRRLLSLARRKPPMAT